MFLHVTDAKYIEDYKIHLSFNNCSSGEINLEHEIFGKIFEPLKDKQYFSQFKISGHTLNWENGADFSPEFLYELLQTESQKS